MKRKVKARDIKKTNNESKKAQGKTVAGLKKIFAILREFH
jgi:hypothetical protein